MRLLLSIAMLVCAYGPDGPLRFEATPAGPRVVARLPADLAGTLPAGRLTQEQGEAVLTLSLLADNAKPPSPSMLGKYERSGTELTFTPRFPLGAGMTYRARLNAAGNIVSLDYSVPRPAPKAPPRVVKIYPSADVLPANHLRFYIYFDRPMRGGSELFQHLAIVDENGKEIEAPWLVDEIWDEANNCLILYIHPGRIKRGVELRESMGPVLHEKRSYTLVVRGDWTDLDGNKIGKDTLKKFRTTAEDHNRIELADWKLTAPKAGTRDPLELALAKSIDYRSLHTGLTVLNAKGETLAGTIAVGPAEKSWHFTPAQPWHAGPHRVSVSPDLEDVAGNTPSRPFDLDLLTPIGRAQKLRLEFEPRYSPIIVRAWPAACNLPYNRGMFPWYPDYEYPLARLQLVLFMLGMGLTLSVVDFLAVLRRPRSFLAGFTVQVLVLPWLAVAINALGRLEGGLAVGLVLVAAMPGGALSKLFTYLGRGNVPLSISLSAFTTLASLVSVPVLLQLLAPHYVPEHFRMPVEAIVLDVALCLLCPLAAGMVLARLLPHQRRAVARWSVRLGFVVVGVMILGSLGRINPGEHGLGVAIAIILFCLAGQQLSMLPFYVLRWPRPDRMAVGIEVTMRNMNLALLLKAILFPAGDELGSGVLFVILFYAGTALVAGVPLALNHRRLARKETPVLQA